jgi:hypothetical protein
MKKTNPKISSILEHIIDPNTLAKYCHLKSSERNPSYSKRKNILHPIKLIENNLSEKSIEYLSKKSTGSKKKNLLKISI